MQTEEREHDPATDPGGGECVACYVHRMLRAHGCDSTLRWAGRFRDLRSPTGSSLERRFTERGGLCDCEIFEHDLRLARHVLVRDLHTDALEEPEERPACGGVRRTSTRPCTNWERQPRW